MNHQHDFTTWQLEPIIRIENIEYHGTAGDKAFIVRQCATCPAKVYSEYGSKSDMEKRLWELVGKIG